MQIRAPDTHPNSPDPRTHRTGLVSLDTVRVRSDPQARPSERLQLMLPDHIVEGVAQVDVNLLREVVAEARIVRLSYEPPIRPRRKRA